MISALQDKFPKGFKFRCHHTGFFRPMLIWEFKNVLTTWAKTYIRKLNDIDRYAKAFWPKYVVRGLWLVVLPGRETMWYSLSLGFCRTFLFGWNKQCWPLVSHGIQTALFCVSGVCVWSTHPAPSPTHTPYASATLSAWAAHVAHLVFHVLSV